MIRLPIHVYVKKRNEMLLLRSPRALMRFMKLYTSRVPSSLAVAEITMHKAISAVESLPSDFRLESEQWLEARGLISFADGDLNDQKCSLPCLQLRRPFAGRTPRWRHSGDQVNLRK